MAKFVSGDRFLVSQSGAMGTVESLSYNALYGYTEYFVRWDSSPSHMGSFVAHEVDSLWEKIETDLKNSGILPTGNYNVGSIYTEKEDYNCFRDGHAWVDVGFHFTKIVCKHCDKEKGKL